MTKASRTLTLREVLSQLARFFFSGYPSSMDSTNKEVAMGKRWVPDTGMSRPKGDDVVTAAPPRWTRITYDGGRGILHEGFIGTTWVPMHEVTGHIHNFPKGLGRCVRCGESESAPGGEDALNLSPESARRGDEETPGVPTNYRDGSIISTSEREMMRFLRDAGCSCPFPLLGWRPGSGPRCRLCNTEVALSVGSATSVPEEPLLETPQGDQEWFDANTPPLSLVGTEQDDLDSLRARAERLDQEEYRDRLRAQQEEIGLALQQQWEHR